MVAGGEDVAYLEVTRRVGGGTQVRLAIGEYLHHDARMVCHAGQLHVAPQAGCVGDHVQLGYGDAVGRADNNAGGHVGSVGPLVADGIGPQRYVGYAPAAIGCGACGETRAVDGNRDVAIRISAQKVYDAGNRVVRGRYGRGWDAVGGAGQYRDRVGVGCGLEVGLLEAHATGVVG